MLPHGLKEIRCEGCGEICFKNKLSGNKVKLHKRADPAWAPTGPGGRLDVVTTPVYTLHRCGEKPPVLVTSGEATAGAALELVRELARDCGIEIAAAANLEASREALVACVNDLRQEAADARDGTTAAEMQEQIDGLTRSLKASEKAKLALEQAVKEYSGGARTEPPPSTPKRDTEPSAPPAALEEDELEAETEPYVPTGEENGAASFQRARALQAPEGVTLGRKPRPAAAPADREPAKAPAKPRAKKKAAPA